MADLFTYAGAKGRTAATRRTSADSADAIHPCRARLQRAALQALADFGPATPIEVSSRAGATPDAIKPRLSELLAIGHVAPTGARRRNPSGRSAAVLAITAAGRAALAKP